MTRWLYFGRLLRATGLTRLGSIRERLSALKALVGRTGPAVGQWLSGIARRWRGWSRARRVFLAVGLGLVIALAVLGGFTWSGVSAAQDARQAYRELEAELSHLTHVDLIQVEVVQSLEGRFADAERASDRARSRLFFLKAFQWLPVVGDDLKEAQLLLDMGFYQSRAGRNLVRTQRAAISAASEDLTPDQAAEAVTRVLRESDPRLAQVRKDLRQAVRLQAELRKLGATKEGARYASLVDRYLPTIQTFDYLMRTSPESIGNAYALNRELSTLQALATDFLEVIADPAAVDRSLGDIAARAAAVESSLDTVRQSTPEDQEEIAEVLGTLIRGVTMLRRVTAGTRGLVTMAEAMESTGFLSKEFGEVMGVSLTRARQDLALARDEVTSLQALLSDQAETLPPQRGFGGGSSTGRVEQLLDEAISGTNFMISLLGYDTPRTYLLLGQNQNEIRATGGVIGTAVQMEIDKGELTDLVYFESSLDKEPLFENPLPPDPVYFYLWMGRLLFRDSNWNPHFPASAARAAELFRVAKDVQVDGVLTASKMLVQDLVTLFGDVTVPGAEGPLTRERAVAYTEGEIPYVCRPSFHDSSRRERCFDQDLVLSLKDKLTSGVAGSLRASLAGC